MNKFDKEDWFGIIYFVVLSVSTFCCIMMGAIGGKQWIKGIDLTFIKQLARLWMIGNGNRQKWVLGSWLTIVGKRV